MVLNKPPGILRRPAQVRPGPRAGSAPGSPSSLSTPGSRRRDSGPPPPHTAAAAAPLITRQALVDQAGIIATTSFSELLDAAVLIASQPVPAGSRVAIVSNGGGADALAADACAGKQAWPLPLPARYSMVPDISGVRVADARSIAGSSSPGCRAAAGCPPARPTTCCAATASRRWSSAGPRDVDAAIDAAASLGGHVVIKVLKHRVLHKTDAGAVELDLHGGHEVREAMRRLQGKFAGRMTGVLVRAHDHRQHRDHHRRRARPVFDPSVVFLGSGLNWSDRQYSGFRRSGDWLSLARIRSGSRCS